jgi:hypothetical protein
MPSRFDRALEEVRNAVELAQSQNGLSEKDVRDLLNMLLDEHKED